MNIQIGPSLTLPCIFYVSRIGETWYAGVLELVRVAEAEVWRSVADVVQFRGYGLVGVVGVVAVDLPTYI